MGTSQAGLSKLKWVRRDKILKVAERLFAQQGFRATTMEGVAASVGMSKATVYAYFSDKDKLFEGVAIAVADRIREVVKTALIKDGPVETRIAEALVAKHDLVFDVVRTSAFAQELFSVKDKFAITTFRDLDDEVQSMLMRALAEGGIPKGKVETIGSLLFGASTGIANHAVQRENMKAEIELMVGSVIAQNR